MAWRIEFADSAAREFRKLDRQIQQRIDRFLTDRLASLDDPRSIGSPLHGPKSGFWRFRVGDWRLICGVEDARLVVVVVRVAHRREVYDR